MRAWHVQVQKLVSDGKKAGEFRPEVDPKAVASVIISPASKAPSC